MFQKKQIVSNLYSHINSTIEILITFIFYYLSVLLFTFYTPNIFFSSSTALINSCSVGICILYLSFRIFNYDFPVFNLADMLIVVGIFLVLIKEIRGAIYEVRSK